MEHNQTEVCKMQFANIHSRLEKLEEKTDDIALLRERLDNLTKSVDLLIKKIDVMLEKPSKRWESVVSSFISTIVGLAVGYFISRK